MSNVIIQKVNLYDIELQDSPSSDEEDVTVSQTNKKQPLINRLLSRKGPKQINISAESAQKLLESSENLDKIEENAFQRDLSDENPNSKEQVEKDGSLHQTYDKNLEKQSLNKNENIQELPKKSSNSGTVKSAQKSSKNIAKIDKVQPVSSPMIANSTEIRAQQASLISPQSPSSTLKRSSIKNSTDHETNFLTASTNLTTDVVIKEEVIEIEDNRDFQQTWPNIDESLFIKQEHELICPSENLDDEELMEGGSISENIDKVEDSSHYERCIGTETENSANIEETTKDDESTQIISENLDDLLAKGNLGILDEKFGFFVKGSENSHLEEESQETFIPSPQNEDQNPPKRIKIEESIEIQTSPSTRAIAVKSTGGRQVACKSTSKVTSSSPTTAKISDGFKPATKASSQSPPAMRKVADSETKLDSRTSTSSEPKTPSPIIKPPSNPNTLIKVGKRFVKMSDIMTANGDKSIVVGGKLIKIVKKPEYFSGSNVKVMKSVVGIKKPAPATSEIYESWSKRAANPTSEIYESWKKVAEGSTYNSSSFMGESSGNVSQNSTRFGDDTSSMLEMKIKEEPEDEVIDQNPETFEKIPVNQNQMEGIYEDNGQKISTDNLLDVQVKEEKMDEDADEFHLTSFYPSFDPETGLILSSATNIKEEELEKYYTGETSADPSEAIVSTKIVNIPNAQKQRKIIVIKKPVGSKAQGYQNSLIERLQKSSPGVKVVTKIPGSPSTSGQGSIKYIIKSAPQNSPKPITSTGNGMISKQNTVYRCQKCHLLFTNHSEYTEHIKEHRTGIVINQKRVIRLEELQKMNQYQCSQCPAGFPTIEKLSAHENRHKTEFECKYCNKKFLLQYRYKEHLQLHEIKKEKYIECKICNKKFLKQERFNEHMAMHNPKELFACGICDKKFPNNFMLIDHQKIVHAKKVAFKCGVCNYETLVKQNFEKHASMHMRFVEKITSSTFYKCDKCPQSFREQGALDMHKNHMHGGS